MRTTLELFLCLPAEEDAVLYHRTALDITGRGEDPDQLLASVLAGLGIVTDPAGACAHSTSWRFEHGTIILTYLVLTPLLSLAGLTTRRVYPEAIAPAAASAPLRPRPTNIALDQVVAHGLGHLRYLAEERGEPFVSEALRRTGFPVFTLFEPTLAGRLHLS